MVRSTRRFLASLRGPAGSAFPRGIRPGSGLRLCPRTRRHCGHGSRWDCGSGSEDGGDLPPPLSYECRGRRGVEGNPKEAFPAIGSADRRDRLLQCPASQSTLPGNAPGLCHRSHRQSRRAQVWPRRLPAFHGKPKFPSGGRSTEFYWSLIAALTSAQPECNNR